MAGRERETGFQTLFDGLLRVKADGLAVRFLRAGKKIEGFDDAVCKLRSVSANPYASRNTLIAFLSSAVLNTEVAVLPELVVA